MAHSHWVHLAPQQQLRARAGLRVGHATRRVRVSPLSWLLALRGRWALRARPRRAVCLVPPEREATAHLIMIAPCHARKSRRHGVELKKDAA